MAAGRRAGLLGRMPPERITARVLNMLGVSRTSRQQDVLAALAHLAFGAAAGAAYQPLQNRLPMPAVFKGIAYGSVIWTVSYMGWVPALGLMPPPSRDRPGRPWVMLTAHWVYGGLLALLLQGPGERQAARRRSERSTAKRPITAPTTA